MDSTDKKMADTESTIATPVADESDDFKVDDERLKSAHRLCSNTEFHSSVHHANNLISVSTSSSSGRQEFLE